MLSQTQNRYKEFNHVIRLWRHLHLLKCAGRGNIDSGASGTTAGELAVECPACPQPGRNLPLGWVNVGVDRRFVCSSI